MQATETTEMQSAVRVAGLLAAELDQAVERNEFGVIVRDVTPLDLSTLTDAIARPRSVRLNRLRLAMVDAADAVRQAVIRHPELKPLLCPDEETAVQWRNQRLRTIAVVTSRPLAKAASLREFRIIDEHDIAARLCREERDCAEVGWLRALWDALERAQLSGPTRGRGLRFALSDLVRFASALAELPAADRSTHAPRHLHLLGIFPDAHLADEHSETRLRRRLQQNREFMLQVQRAGEDDWKRIRSFVRELFGAPKARAGRAQRRLRDVAKGESPADLDFTEAQTLWQGRVKSNVGNGSTARSPGEKIEVERAVGRMLMADDESRLGEIAEEVRQVVQAAFDEDVHTSSQDIKQASDGDSTATITVSRDLLNLVRSRSTSEDWGGVIEIASDKPVALTEVAAFKSWKPFTLTDVRQNIQSFVDGEIAPPALLDALNEVNEARAALVPFVCELATSPVAFLAGSPKTLAVAEGYLEAYERLLRQLHVSYQDMHQAADYEAESIIGGILCLELYIYRRDQVTEAVLSPLHPLYLWRSVTVVRDVRGLGRVLSEHEIETIEHACADDVQFLQVLVVPRLATGQEQPIMLGQAGLLGRLPIFREAPRGVLEPDGVRTVAELAQKLAMLRPFARPGLQVVLVNLPRPAKFIEELVGRLDVGGISSDSGFWGLHVRVRYTQSDTKGWAADIRELDDGLQERVSTAEELGLLSLSVQGDPVPWDKLKRELQETPAHLLVIVDPFEVRSTPVARARAHDLSPWMPAKEYRFNRIRKEIQVIPVAEEHVFGSYIAAAALVHTALQRKTPAHLPQVREVKDVMDELAELATWTVVADPHRVPLARLGSAEVIDRRMERGRQLTCFARDLAPFVRRLDDQLRRTHFRAERDTLERLVRDLVAMEPNGILGLASTNHEKQVKGSLGKLIAVRWYRNQEPSGLAVSLDTPNAQRWLVAGHHGGQKADLLGLREEDGGLELDAIEVKAHDDTQPYVVADGRISGGAVNQVLATLQALAEVFAPDAGSPLAKPRREVLREHLYAALLRDQEPGYIERWHTLIEDAFAGRIPVRLAGRIIHVRLASVAAREGQAYVTEHGVPVRVDTLSAEDVGLVLRSTQAANNSPQLPTAPKGLPEVSGGLDPTVALNRLLETGRGRSNPLEPGLAEAPADPAALRKSCPEPIDGESHEATQPTETPTQIPDRPDGAGVVRVVLGTEHASSRIVEWLPGKQSNGFFLLLGASGSGKTETLKVLGSSIAEAGVPVLVLDFHGDVKFPGAESVLLSSGSASTHGLNPMELDVHSAEESGLYDQRAAIRGMIHRAVPALGHRQSAVLREAFDEAYLRSGIVDNDPSTWRIEAPTFGDIQSILSEWQSLEERKSQRAAIEGCLAAVQELFGHPIFSRANHVSIETLLSSSVRLDLSKLPDQIRFVTTESLLRKIFRVLRLKGPIPVQPADDRQRFRLFVVIDEAKVLSMGGGDRDRTDNILNELITEARKFGLGMVLASQMSEHFSEEVRANAATWLVLRPMDIREAKKNAPNVGVDPEDLIRLQGRGDGYYRDRSGGRARRIQIRPLA